MRWTLFTIMLVVVGCSAPVKPPNKFSDNDLIKIYDLKDRRSTDSLLNYFLKAENPIYRRATALAFGSIQDSVASRELGNLLLEDPDAEVRRNAAFALGQTGGFLAVSALIPSLEGKERSVVREVLEALGKAANRDDIQILSDFITTDTLLEEGQAWGFYQLALRKKADSSITKRATEFLRPSHSFQTRLAAAHFFGRSSKIAGTGFEENLINAALHDTRMEVRMASVNGFRHLEASKALPALKGISKGDNDYRVRVNAVRACQNFPAETQDVVFGALKDSVEIVQVAAAEFSRNNPDRKFSKRISVEISESKSERVKANLYATLFKSAPQDGSILEDVTRIYPSASTYFKAGLLSALGEAMSPLDQKAFAFLSQELLKEASEKVLLTTAASAIVSINRNATTTIPKRNFLKIYEQAIGQGDAGVIGIICSVLTNESLHYEKEIGDISFLKNAKAGLTLPKDIESLQPLEEAIAYLEGRPKPAPLKNQFNHPIDWKLVKTIPTDQEVEITTTKGAIVLRMLVEESPGSVANFVELVNKKYFDGKFFHRVVPNFVIQTGCNRGDGFGSENYSIRSEFSLTRYSNGSVGMASAGKDTEGTQWFITHSPTPHLDGKYTIFAEVMKGMEAVHRMDVGDKILEARMK